MVINEIGEVIRKKFSREVNAIVNSVEFKCDSQRPIYVSYTNNTPKAIEYIEINFKARLPQYSSNILDWSAELESDCIV